jgi:ketosteroid isomerase-like protein
LGGTIEGGTKVTENPNVTLVRRLFSSWTAGDAPTAVSILSPQIRYYGYDHKGTAREFSDRDDFFAMVIQAVTQTDEFTNELVQAFPVGETLVVAHVHARRRAKKSQEAVDDDFVIAYRIENGQITHGIDLCGPALVDFWKRNAAG